MNCVNCQKLTNLPFILFIDNYEANTEVFCDLLCCRSYHGVQNDNIFLSNYKESVKKYKKILDKYILMNKINKTADSEEYRELLNKYRFIHYEYNVIPLNNKQKNEVNFLTMLKNKQSFYGSEYDTEASYSSDVSEG